MSKTIAINAGSSSLKWKLYEMPEETEIASGIIERIGLTNALFKIQAGEHQGFEEVLSAPTHVEAVRKLLDELKNKKIIHSFDDLTGIGHRVVAGGERFKHSVLVDQHVIDQVKELSELAPLHNPANAIGLESFYKLLPQVTSVAVFDTSFHQTLKPVQFLYSIPIEYYEKYKARKYGAHGISHEYVAHVAADMLERPFENLKIITCHLGNGSSLTAIEGGQSVDTSMGFTPLSGVTMGTRSGDIDASLLPHLMKKLCLRDIQEMIDILNQDSGLKGISGISSDMRDIRRHVETDDRAKIAIDIFIDRIKKYIGSYAATMNGVDAIVFTAGIGENNPWLRERIIHELSFLGATIDHDKNEVTDEATIISCVDSKVSVLMIPTDEEIMIAREVEKFKTNK